MDENEKKNKIKKTHQEEEKMHLGTIRSSPFSSSFCVFSFDGTHILTSSPKSAGIAPSDSIQSKITTTVVSRASTTASTMSISRYVAQNLISNPLFAFEASTTQSIVSRLAICCLRPISNLCLY